MSSCLAKSPEHWIDRWLHNEYGFFNPPVDAQSVVPPASDGFAVFAYRLFSHRFVDGETGGLPFSDLAIEPLPPDFRSLGFDVVNKTCTAFFECSPLSCNGVANQVAVNRYRLLENLAEAVSLADRFSREEPEPGPYYIVDVLRATA